MTDLVATLVTLALLAAVILLCLADSAFGLRRRFRMHRMRRALRRAERHWPGA